MGLDMTLKAGIYIPGFSFNPKQKELALSIIDGVAPKEDAELFKTHDTPSLILLVDVAYWRKANAIHGWFVENCQENVDICQESYVSREALRELRSLCSELLESRDEREAMKRLPPTRGFFFGDYEIDRQYWDDLEDTVNQLTWVLKLSNEWDFAYQSSW